MAENVFKLRFSTVTTNARKLLTCVSKSASSLAHISRHIQHHIGRRSICNNLLYTIKLFYVITCQNVTSHRKMAKVIHLRLLSRMSGAICVQHRGVNFRPSIVLQLIVIAWWLSREVCACCVRLNAIICQSFL